MASIKIDGKPVMKKPKITDVETIRTKLDLSREDLANATGVSARTIARYETGQTKPTNEFKFKLYGLLETEISKREQKLEEELRKSDPARQEMEDYLVNQLIDKGLDTPVFRGLIRDYLVFYDAMESLKKDIQTRGATLQTATGVRKNESVTIAIQTSKQMLDILAKMKLDVQNAKPKEELDV